MGAEYTPISDEEVMATLRRILADTESWYRPVTAPARGTDETDGNGLEEAA